MGSEHKFLGAFIHHFVGKLSIKYCCACNNISLCLYLTFQLTALLVKYNIMFLENASWGCQHKCLGALGAHFISYRYDPMLATFLYVHVSQIVGRDVMLEGARTHDPGEQV